MIGNIYYSYTVQPISQTQQCLLLPLSHLQALLKYRSKVNTVHSAFWDPKRLH